MNLIRKKILLFIFLAVFTEITLGQKAPAFWHEIVQFKKSDSLNFPGRKKILFTGSSSFRMWNDVQDYFPSYPIINRGFGGSTLPDMIRYVDDIIYPYDPKQIFIYCGENDLASSDTVTPIVVLDRFKILFSLIREKYPKAEVVFVSIKPSPSRRKLMPKMLVTNLRIKNFLEKKPRTNFVDVYHKMLKKDGTVLTDIWKEDSLHMTSKGYAIWQKAIRPYLKK